MESITGEQGHWEVERLINRRVRRYGRGQVTQYLVRWKGYGPEHDKWFSTKELANAKELWRMGVPGQLQSASGVIARTSA